MYVHVWLGTMYKTCIMMYYSIVHTRLVDGSDMSAHVYARWVGFQMLVVDLEEAHTPALPTQPQAELPVAGCCGLARAAAGQPASEPECVTLLPGPSTSPLQA